MTEPAPGEPKRPRPPRPRRAAPNPGPTEPRDGYTAVGRVVRAHGIRGELRVIGFNPEAPHLQKGRRVFLRGERYRIQRSRFDRDAWILQLEGLRDRTVAEGMRGQLLEVGDAELIRADEESFFHHELIGLRVVTMDGRELGAVTEVIETGANDVYVVKGDLGEVLVPAVGEVIDSVDVKGGVIRITPLPGMLDESQ